MQQQKLEISTTTTTATKCKTKRLECGFMPDEVLVLFRIYECFEMSLRTEYSQQPTNTNTWKSIECESHGWMHSSHVTNTQTLQILLPQDNMQCELKPYNRQHQKKNYHTPEQKIIKIF